MKTAAQMNYKILTLIKASHLPMKDKTARNFMNKKMEDLNFFKTMTKFNETILIKTKFKINQIYRFNSSKIKI